MGATGFALLALVLAAGLLAPWLAPHDPLRTNLVMGGPFRQPGLAHHFGTDNLGRDVFSRVIHGIGLSIWVAGAGVAAGMTAGVPLGAVAGMAGGLVERVTMRVMDALLAFPLLVLAIAVSVALGRGPAGVVVAVAFVNLPVFARLARGQTLKIVAMPYMTAAVVMGCGFSRRLFRHVLPNLANPVLVQASVALSFAVLIEAGLSFLGLGIQGPRPALGLMIAEAKAYIALAPHLVFFPSLALVLIVVAINLIGDALAEAAGPPRRGG
jgi:peptide/nickel transport system permease protein